MQCNSVEMIVIGSRYFTSQKDAIIYVRQLLSDIGVCNRVSQTSADNMRILKLIALNHPDHANKLRNFQDFSISMNAMNHGAFELNIININGTVTDISWRACATGVKPSRNKVRVEDGYKFKDVFET